MAILFYLNYIIVATVYYRLYCFFLTMQASKVNTTSDKSNALISSLTFGIHCFSCFLIRRNLLPDLVCGKYAYKWHKVLIRWIIPVTVEPSVLPSIDSHSLDAIVTYWDAHLLKQDSTLSKLTPLIILRNVTWKPIVSASNQKNSTTLFYWLPQKRQFLDIYAVHHNANNCDGIITVNG